MFYSLKPLQTAFKRPFPAFKQPKTAKPQKPFTNLTKTYKNHWAHGPPMGALWQGSSLNSNAASAAADPFPKGSSGLDAVPHLCQLVDVLDKFLEKSLRNRF